MSEPRSSETGGTTELPGTNPVEPPAPEQPAGPWEVAARRLIEARVARLPDTFRELVKTLPADAPPEVLMNFLDQVEKAASTGPPPLPAPDPRRSPPETTRGDERLWDELMRDGRRALDLKRRRPDLYESLRRRFSGRSPRSRKD